MGTWGVAGRVGREACSILEEVIGPTKILALYPGWRYSESLQFLSQRSEMTQGPGGLAGSPVGYRPEARPIHCWFEGPRE